MGMVEKLAKKFAEKEGRGASIEDLVKARWFAEQFSDVIRAEATKRHEKPKEFHATGFDFDMVYGWLRAEMSNE